jgi:hypothetical protein
MERIEFIYYLLGNVFYGIIIGGFVWYIISLVRAWLYEKEINKEKDQPVAMPIIEGAIKKLKKDYEPKIKELERKRQFILDKLPFIK